MTMTVLQFYDQDSHAEFNFHDFCSMVIKYDTIYTNVGGVEERKTTLYAIILTQITV